MRKKKKKKKKKNRFLFEKNGFQNSETNRKKGPGKKNTKKRMYNRNCQI